MTKPVDNTTYHVISITPDQQAALKFCLFHLISLKVMFCLNAVMKTPTVERTENAAEVIIKTFSEYDVLTNQWPIVQDIKARGSNKLYYFDKGNFRWLITAVERFDPETAVIMIGEEKVKIMAPSVNPLKKLLAESAKYEYTLSKIRGEMGRK